MRSAPSLSPSRDGFTLMELMSVITIIFILTVMVMQTSTGWKQKADQAKCLTNLKSLYIGASNYLLQQGHWPQIDPKTNFSGRTDYAKSWIAALSPFGISRQSWVCPTVQSGLGSPDLSKEENIRVDYLATPFDERPNTPYLWATQPWFVEKSSSHPGGNLLIFEDGQTKTLSEVTRHK